MDIVGGIMLNRVSLYAISNLARINGPCLHVPARVVKFAKSHETYRMDICGFTDRIQDPKYQLGIMFYISKNKDYNWQRGYFLIDGKCYERMTYKDLNMQVRSGLKTTRPGFVQYYLTPHVISQDIIDEIYGYINSGQARMH